MVHKSPPVVWLGEEAPVAEVGGKFASLSRLSNAGFPIPTAFCVTATAMDVLAKGSSPAWLTAALSRLDTRWAAVRSSAPAEDSKRASFAGIHTTRLNVPLPAGVRVALEQVRASAFTPTALAYRVKREIHVTPRMAAIVQSMVHADVAGVLVTSEPSHSAHMIVEASWGLGESVVGGDISPDSYTLDSNGVVVARTISDKKISIRPRKDGGTKIVPVEDYHRLLPCLDDAMLAQLWTLGCRCELLFGTPQDVEWAIRERQAFLLQSRPVTTPLAAWKE